MPAKYSGKFRYTFFLHITVLQAMFSHRNYIAVSLEYVIITPTFLIPWSLDYRRIHLELFFVRTTNYRGEWISMRKKSLNVDVEKLYWGFRPLLAGSRTLYVFFNQLWNTKRKPSFSPFSNFSLLFNYMLSRMAQHTVRSSSCTAHTIRHTTRTI